jgi:hypothetical protein
MVRKNSYLVYNFCFEDLKFYFGSFLFLILNGLQNQSSVRRNSIKKYFFDLIDQNPGILLTKALNIILLRKHIKVRFPDR